MGRLDDQVALVTGAARGLGAGISRALAAEGALVVCTDILDSEAVASGLPTSPSGRRGMAALLDVTDTLQVENVIAEVVRNYGSLDILVNDAGVPQPKADVADTPDEVVNHVLAVNVRGVFATCRAASRIMRERRRGRIINIASQVGKLAWAQGAIYAASKAAVISITQALALELGPYNVTVNSICPGTIDTEMTRYVWGQLAVAAGQDTNTFLASKAASIPVGRLGTAEDVGAMVVWLASDAASFTTGAALNLTGGEQVFF